MTRFDLYISKPKDYSPGYKNFDIDLDDLIKHSFFQKQDITIKVVTEGPLDKPLRGLSAGTIQLMGYFNIFGYNFGFQRIGENNPLGVIIKQINVASGTNYYDIESIIDSLDTAIKEFNKFIKDFKL